MRKTAKVIDRTHILDMWKEIISNMEIGKSESKKTFLISDVDGTLDEGDPELCQAVAGLPNAAESITLLIATGRPVNERKNSTRFAGRTSLGKNVPVILGQGGSVVYVQSTEMEQFYIVPITEDMNEMVDTIAKGLGKSRKELFREENLCMHFFDFDKVKEVIAIPIAKEDENVVRKVLKKYDGNIVQAVLAGEIYSVAVEEYLERGKPEDEIGVLYESEISDKVYTELTIVNSDLSEVQHLLIEKFGIEIRIQQQIADRYPNTRGCTNGVKPDIADVVDIDKKSHIDAIIEVVKDFGGITIGFGDQANDNFLYSTTYSFVVDAADRLDEEAGWDFAIEMAERAQSYDKNGGPKVIHAEHGPNGSLGNWCVKKVIEADGFDERVRLLNELAASDKNLSKRELLLAKKK